MAAIKAAGGKNSNASVTLLGEGRTTAISVVTVCLLFALWWLATHFRWLPPLVLPSPESVWDAFMASNRGELQGDKTLSEHFGWSFARVFGAFILAVVTAIPIGILMGVSRVARGIFDPPIEFYRPLPPLDHPDGPLDVALRNEHHLVRQLANDSRGQLTRLLDRDALR